MQINDDDAEIIAAARAGFLDEAADTLRQFEQALLVMEDCPGDVENLHAAFRAAHTIKGTAGLFGCDAVVAFTHEVETLLEALRSGHVAVDAAVCAALLEGLDQMTALMGEVRSGTSDPAVADRSVALGARLRTLHAPAGHDLPAADAPAAPSAAHADAAGAHWHLSLRFGVDALRNGLDPLAFLRYLGSVGRVLGCECLEAAVPPLEDLDAEACHLGFEIALECSEGREAIEQAIRHYDYSKLNMAELFFAECAYYALPAK